MKKFYHSLIIFLVALNATAQPILNATNVNIVITPGAIVNCQGGLTFNGTTVVKQDGTINLLPSTVTNNWTDNTATGTLDITSIGLVHLNSNTVQDIVGNSKFYNLRVNNTNGINLLSNAEVRNQLNLDDGLITTNANRIWVSNPAIAAIQSSSAFATSWVKGKLARTENIVGTEYLFPIGKNNGAGEVYAPIKLDKFNANSAIHTAEYLPVTPVDFTNFLNPPIDHLSQIEYWHIESNIASGVDDDAKVSLSYRAGSVVNASAAIRDSLLVAQYTALPRWEATGGGFPNVVTGSPTFGYVKNNDWVGNFTPAERQFTLASFSIYNILPYNLISWNAFAQSNAVQLKWNIEFEQDVDEYIIEKSINGLNFTMLLTTPAYKLTSSAYTKLDNAPAKGWNYYKLKIKNVQGNIASAGIRKVWYGDASISTISIYPNPTQQVLNVNMPKYNGNTTVQIYATDGKLMATYKATNTLLQIDVAKYAQGNYTLKVVENNATQTFLFNKQ